MEETEAEEIQPIVPFKLKTIDGKTFNSKRDLNGRVSILAFWRLEQDQSMALLDELMELRTAFPEDEVNIVTIISGKASTLKAKKVVKEKGLTFPVLLEPDRNVYASFGVIVSPTTWFLDAEGNKQLSYPGHRRDFATTSKAHIEFLLGQISEEEHASRIKKRAAPRTHGTVGAPVRYRFAMRHLEDGNRQAAKEQLRLAWDAEPPMIEAGVDLGLLLLQDEKLEEALSILKEAAKLLPEDSRAQGALGLALIRSGEMQEGEFLLRKALRSGLKEPLFFYEMGRLSELDGDAVEALHFYKQGLKLSVDAEDLEAN